MNLTDILYKVATTLPLTSEQANLFVSGITDNSSEVTDGDLFIAIKGVNQDGHDHIQTAIQKGAAAIIGEQIAPLLSIPYIQVENSRKTLAWAAKNFYGDPSQRKTVIGITGTNGKTTTSFLLKHLFEENGQSCSLIGTIQNVINDEVIPSRNTTPSALTLYKLLAKSKDDVVVMEVSSHGIDQYRIEGIEFDCCLFTNLHHEHLDYHGTMEAYFEKKAVLFNQLKENGVAIINTEDDWGEKLAMDLKHKGTTVITVGSNKENVLCLKDFQAQNPSVTVIESGEEATVTSPMVGIHNLYNTVMAYATAYRFGVTKQQITHTLPLFAGVGGRFEMTKLPNGVTVVIDYAHTSDALYYCLTAARSQGATKLIHVFGFRGDRDESKRTDMLRVSSIISDRYILTHDDLNSVSPSEMTHTLEKLNQSFGNEKGIVVPDRSLAIQHAIHSSSSGDWVIITGKGIESYKQVVQLETNSDKETVQLITHHQELRPNL
ncbi:UDP-N-acetylmuramoyl-L-alanyl-D-glutamate--2,6-diaminopimelate ligase [Planococcus lenghuensis]|uniref:UDP-N-acetylmuramyl-tripeptide synthetase n=1 Tax=Planococcus lenghuensis TaxID=2213202 RepID=A0A1Q2L4B1_9BACL|nr:UDP-N-acetylmuramoyl-L-alanyl-D-glutamate--2,6-diaminopimelate ligase [Planococcus lenghuensis]AQQ55298.1 UDP-N-acetylmuramoyl-L-alanyl-D-glutamate--2,6-diaminopimelate ligase [Planococcus lenghuensis]